MCGVAGVLTAGALTGEDRAIVGQLSELMVRRGPDDAGVWDDGAHCALAVRRLSIIDVTQGGHQPMTSRDGDQAVAYNGELYNYRELRAELAGQGRRFCSSSDTEVVLQALAAWGTAAFERFNGMFALAWYRARERTLVLARDPMGIKPLYWFQSPAGLVFGSQYDQVVRHPWCDRARLRPDVLELYLRLGWVPAPWGLIEGTGQLEPGTYLEASPGSTPVARRYHRLPEAGSTAPLIGAEAVEAVDEAVRAAVRRQQVSDVRVGALLSGGIDSPLVVAGMRRGADWRPVPAFTIGVDDPAFDESVVAGAFGRHLGVEHHVEVIDAGVALGLVDDVAAAWSEPFADYSAFPTMLVSSLARRGVKTVLSGDGGDELFWGYPRFARLLKARPWFHLPRAGRVAAYAASKPLPTHRRPRRGICFGSVGDWYLDAHSGLRDRDLRRIAPGTAGLPGDFDLFRLDGTPGRTELAEWMRRNELRVHLPMLLCKVDRASMYHSLEVRVPLLDLEVVDVAHRLRVEDCIEGAVGKIVLRKALARHAPQELVGLPKRGFSVPLGSWLRHELEPLVRDRLLDRDPFPTGFFDGPGLASFYDDHRSGRLDLTRGLWHLLALQLWADHHLRPLDRERTAA